MAERADDDRQLLTLMSSRSTKERQEVCPFSVVSGSGFFSPDGINPVRDEITWTRLICFSVKLRRKQFGCVYLDVARSNVE